MDDEVRLAEKKVLRAKSCKVFEALKLAISSRASRSHPPAPVPLHWRYGQDQSTNLQPTVLSLKAFVVLVWYLNLKDLQGLAHDIGTLRLAGEYINTHEKFRRLPKWWFTLYESWLKEKALAMEFRRECFQAIEAQDVEDHQEKDKPAYIIAVAPKAQLSRHFADEVLRSMERTPSWNDGYPVVFNVQGHHFSNKTQYQVEVSENRYFTEKEVFRDEIWGRITGIQRRNILCIECDGDNQNAISNHIFGDPST